MASLINEGERRLSRFRHVNRRLSRRSILGAIPLIACGETLLSKRARAFGLLFAGGGTTAGITGTLLNVTDATYGAKAATQISDAAITSGQATLTSTQFTFSSANIGQTAAVKGAGAAGVWYISTISSINNSHSVQMAANAGTTVSGALGVIGPDSTSAWQGALNDAVNTYHGADIFGPSGIYLIAGALGVTPNAQLSVPFVNLGTSPPTQEVSVNIIGSFYGPQGYFVNGSGQLPFTSGTILFSPLTGSGTKPALISASSGSGFNGVNLQFTGITLRTAYQPQAGLVAIDASAASCFGGFGLILDVMETTTNILANSPTVSGDGTALYMPGSGNGAKSVLYDSTIEGKNTGVSMWEHTSMTDVECYFCQQAYLVNGDNHAMHAARLGAYHCPTVIQGTGSTSLFSIDQLDVERSTSGWTGTSVKEVNDASDFIHGTCQYVVVLSGGGYAAANVSGGTNLQLTRMDTL